jgi:hypothetical protein
MPQTILLALDYASGGILYQTRFPGSFNGAGAYSDQKDNSIYVSTLGLQFARGGLKGVASISRFDHQLHLVAAREILGAESSFPLLTCGPNGINMLSHQFSKPFRGVGSAVNDSLEPVDGSCSWSKELDLAMEHCSYSSVDVQCKEEPLEVESADGRAFIRPDSFPLLNLTLKLEGKIEHAKPIGAATKIQQDPEPGQQSSYSTQPKASIRPLGDPQPVAYRATSEVSTQTNGPQYALEEPHKPKADITADPRYGPTDARLNRIYTSLRSILSPAKKQDLKRLEKEFLNRRDQLRGDPDAFFALTEKQISVLEQMRDSASGGIDHSLKDGTGKFAATAVVATSPDGKYQLTRGSELAIGGSGTTAAVLQSNLDISPGRNTMRVIWSPKSDKVLVVSAGDEGTNSLQVAWLRGPNWQSDFCPETSDVPRHYLGDNFTVLGWLSDDTFEVTNAIILNSRKPLPAVRYKVEITAKGPAIVN